MRDGLLMTSGEITLAAPDPIVGNKSLPGTVDGQGNPDPRRRDRRAHARHRAGLDRRCARGICQRLMGADASISPHDVVKLTIDFKLQDGYDGIQLDYVFGSEEYPDYQGDLYPDAFGFFVRPAGSSTFTNFGRDPQGNDININGPTSSRAARSSKPTTAAPPSASTAA